MKPANHNSPGYLVSVTGYIRHARNKPVLVITPCKLPFEAGRVQLAVDGVWKNCLAIQIAPATAEIAFPSTSTLEETYESGQEATFQCLIPDSRPLGIPADFELSTRAAGLNVENIDQSELSFLINFVREARSPAIRAARIESIIRDLTTRMARHDLST